MKDSSTNYASIAGDGTLPVMQGVPITSTVEVIAPAAMNGGYQFSVDIEGRHVLVAVVRTLVSQFDTFSYLYPHVCYMVHLYPSLARRRSQGRTTVPRPCHQQRRGRYRHFRWTQHSNWSLA